MASVLEGLMSSRRRGSRSRSESEKRLHSRWGDATITAPNAGWSQQHPEAQLNHPAGQAHGSPDSQKTLVNQSPDLTYDPDKAATVEPTTHSPPSMVQRERSAIVITIPLPWSRKTQRRSLSVGHLQARDAQPVEHVAPQIDKRLDDRPAEADSWPLVDPLRSSAPGAHPEKGPGPGRLPQLQTGVPPARSQPASAISVLSPVAESFNGLSESNNATPMGTTPIAEAATDGVPPANRVEGITARNLTSRLDIYLSQSPNSLPSSLIANPVELSESDFETSNTQSTAVVSSRPPSCGPGIGEVAHMRSTSRERDQRRSESRGGAGAGGRSASREATVRAESVGPTRRRTVSRDSVGRRTPRSPSRSRNVSPDSFRRRAVSREATSRRSSHNRSREPALRPENHAGPFYSRAASVDSSGQRTPRAVPPEAKVMPASRGGHSREPAVHRPFSPDTAGTSRRAQSCEPHRSHRASPPSPPSSLGRRGSPSLGPVIPRAASVDPGRWHGGSSDDVVIHYRSAPSTRTSPTSVSNSDSSLDTDGSTSPDESTDIETEAAAEAETDETYFESRKGWNGPAGMKGAESKGFYGDVVQDYKAIARDVEAALVGGSDLPPSTDINVVSTTVNKKDKENVPVIYGGPELVPSDDELWG